jgi:transposase
MLNFSGNRRIFLARSPIDMRKGAGSLASIVEYGLSMDPYAGDIFLFVGRAKNRVKLLVWENSGFWICAKRLERGNFAIPPNAMAPDRPGTLPLSPAEIHLLLEGINVHHATYHAHYHRPPLPPMANPAPEGSAALRSAVAASANGGERQS